MLTRTLVFAAVLMAASTLKADVILNSQGFYVYSEPDHVVYGTPKYVVRTTSRFGFQKWYLHTPLFSIPVYKPVIQRRRDFFKVKQGEAK